MRILRHSLIVLAFAVLGCQPGNSSGTAEQSAVQKAVEKAPTSQPPVAETGEANAAKAEQPPAKAPQDPKETAVEETAQNKEEDMANKAPVIVDFETSIGNFAVEIYPDRTPVTVENFLGYVDQGFYAGTIFHRVVPGFVVQGGGFEENLHQKAVSRPIANEAQKGLSNERGTLAMARTQIRDSATAQFYVNLQDNHMLDYRGENPQGWGYCAFGKVIEGLDVLDKMAAMPRERLDPPFTDITRERVVIKGAKRR